LSVDPEISIQILSGSRTIDGFTLSVIEAEKSAASAALFSVHPAASR
jgi:hypothetical protein